MAAAAAVTNLLRIDEIVQAAFMGMLVVIIVHLSTPGGLPGEGDGESANARKRPNYVLMFIATFFITCIMLRMFRMAARAEATAEQDVLNIEDVMRHMDMRDAGF
jgi:hypothetical protein